MTDLWNKIEAEFVALFDREWYTNHGPLAKKFESELANLLSIEEVVCVSNPAIALTMVLESLVDDGVLSLRNKFHCHLQSALHWSRITYDINPNVQASSVLVGGSNLEALALDQLSERCKTCILDLTEGAGADTLANLKTTLENCSCSDVILILSFERGNAIYAQSGACIASNSKYLADRLRSIRSSYGVQELVAVTKTSNGRISEAQCLFGLLSIKSLVAGQG